MNLLHFEIFWFDIVCYNMNTSWFYSYFFKFWNCLDFTINYIEQERGCEFTEKYDGHYIMENEKPFFRSLNQFNFKCNPYKKKITRRTTGARGCYFQTSV